jgi:hypothetical protein
MLKRRLYYFKCKKKWANQARFAAFSRGNTITEYALIGCLVIVFSIVALQLLGSNFNTAMAKIKNDMKSKNQATVTALLAQKAAMAGQIAAGLSVSEQAILASSLTSKLQTTGANGSTEVLAKQIEAAAEQLLKEGKIDQSQYDILMKLANEGHKMAQIQGLVSDAMKYANGNVEVFNGMAFTVDGQSYTAPQLAQMLGLNGPAPADFASANILSVASGGTTGGALGNFLDLYNQALSSGALSDPLAKSTVDSASTQIASLGELTEDIVWNVQNGMSMDTTSITELTSQSATSMASSNICTAGQFVDNGALCSP